MSRRVDPVGSKKCPECGKIKPLEGFSIRVRQPDGSTKYEALDCFTIKGKRTDGSVRYETKCKSCRNKGGGVLWLARSKTHKTCRRCGEFKPRSLFVPKTWNKTGEAVSWHSVCMECRKKNARFPRLHRTATHKTCGECKDAKMLSEFSTKGKTSLGTTLYLAKCRACMRKLRKSLTARRKANDYYKRNREKIKAAARASYQRNKEKRVAQKAVYRENNREEIRVRQKRDYEANLLERQQANRDSYATNAEKRREYRRQYRAKFPDKVRESDRKSREKRYLSGKTAASRREFVEKNKSKLREYERNYRKTDINRNIGIKLRNRINAVLRYNRKSKSTEELLGCNVSEFAVHLQSRFQEGMTWKKFLAGEIHIDHIVPCALFNLSLPEEQAECFHFSNLQPLWATDNLRKPKYVDPKGKRRKRES
jgi:hypothetical protein